MSRTEIGYPSRLSKYNDVILVSDEGVKFPVHKLMLERYPYFAGILDDLRDVSEINIPFSSECVKHLLEIIYKEVNILEFGKSGRRLNILKWEYEGDRRYIYNHPITKNFDLANELFKAMNWVGIYFDELFGELFWFSNFEDSKKLLASYGTPKRIGTIPEFSAEDIYYVKYLCCITNDHFEEIIHEIEKNPVQIFSNYIYAYVVVRYLCIPSHTFCLEILEKWSKEETLKIPFLECFNNVKKRLNNNKISHNIIKHVKKIVGNDYLKEHIDNYFRTVK